MALKLKSSGSYYVTFDDSALTDNRTFQLPNVSGSLITSNTTGSFPFSVSSATSSSFATTASFVRNAVSSSFATTASYAMNAAGGGGSSLGAPDFVVTKTAEEIVFNSTTPQADNHLFFTPSTFGTYRWELWLSVYKYNTGTQGLRMEIGAGGNGTWGATWTQPVTIDQTGERVNYNIWSTSERQLIVISGIGRFGGFFGIAFNWAQQFSDTNAVAVREGSQLIGWKVA